MTIFLICNNCKALEVHQILKVTYLKCMSYAVNSFIAVQEKEKKKVSVCEGRGSLLEAKGMVMLWPPLRGG